MKRKKYLACCLAMSMMLASASPMAVSAEAQTDLFFSAESELEEAPASENSEVMQSEIPDSEGDGFISEDTDITDLFDAEAGDSAINGDESSNPNEGWTPLTSISNETRVLYKYDENEKTLYFKCTEPTAIPDYNYGNRTDWFVDLGASTIAQIEKIVIGEGITGIGQYCFQSKSKSSTYTNLKEVELADTVKTIGKGSFDKDSALEKVNLNNVISVGMAAFAKSGIQSVCFDSENIELGENAFNSCASLQSVKAKNITSLGVCAFQDCISLNSFEYEGTIKNIPKEAFEGTALTAFRFGAVESIGLMAFFNCNLQVGCYSGTRESWNAILAAVNTRISEEAIIHCKGDAVEVKEATCTEAGWKEVGVCEVCGERYSYPTEENKIPATGHTWSEDYVVDKEATCTEAGEKSKHCTVCDAKEDVQEIPATGHTWSEDYVVDKEATCTEAGEKSKHCTVCDAKEDVQEIPALGHDFVSKVTKKATCTADGTLTYTCSRCGETKTETIKAAGHKWSSWKRTAAATVFKPEVQTRKCSTCNKSETRNAGKKLTPKATVNASTVTLKVKQSTSGFRVTGLAKGDSVKSWKSSNSKIFAVSGKSNGTCKITGKKSGTAKLQITLASGLKKTVKVKVQASAVKTTKITVANKNVTVQKGKRVTLKPVVTPFTSRQTVTYTSSNKKIATVSSKGVVTGKKKGTVKITVKSGNKSIKVTVRVK